jgi:hypothetical protein
MALQKEYKYLIIIQIKQDDKIISSSNKEPVNSLKLAKEIALQNFPVNIKINSNDIVLIKGFKYIYADVPVESLITGSKYEFQCIACESLTEEEIKSI